VKPSDEGADDKSGARNTSAADVVLQRAVAGFGHRLREANAPSIRVRAGKDEWLLGPGGEEPPVTVDVDEWDLLRGLTGRRSEAQIRGWRWSGDPTPYLAYVSPFPFATSAVAE
jgi:hypothetical protein